MSDRNSSGKSRSGSTPDKEARERYNEKRRQERAAQKQGDNFKRDANGEVVTDRYGNPLYNAQISEKPKKKTGGAGRTRNFATLIYPESASENWQEVLAGFHVPAFISPLHEDMNPDNVAKKPHYHVMIMFESVKTDEQAQEIVSAVGGVGMIRVAHYTNHARYLCHLDDLDPNKKRYNPEDVICIGGADYFAAIYRASDKYQAIFEMVDFCEENNIVSYRELFMYARLHRNDWARVLCDNGTYVIREFLKSKSWENDRYDK